MIEKQTGAEFDLASAKSAAGDIGDLPDIHALERAEDKALWTLLFVKDKLGIEYISVAGICALLASVFEIALDEAAVRMALSRAKGRVHSRTTGRTTKFSIMRPGRDRLQSVSFGRAIIIDPEKPHQAIQRIADFLGGLSGEIKICDPYLDKKTLEVTAMISDSCKVKFLSHPPRDGATFLRQLKAYRVEHPNLEMRTIPHGKIHDRYIISADSIWSVGHSLNAIGSKQSLVVKLGDDARTELEKSIDSMWAAASALG